MIAHVEGGCSWYANKGRCSRRERCYPKMIASEYLVKSNNANDTRTSRCSCTKKYEKLLDLALALEKRYSYKCRRCNSISGHSCVRQKLKQIKRKTCLRINLSHDAIANLWNVPRVCDRSHCVRSQDNCLSESFVKKNFGRFQEESTNVEKLAQEETTSSSYVDAKNCFVQDVCIQTVCENQEETCVERFSDRCEKESKEIIELPKDSSFVFYEHDETKVLKDKFEKTLLNCDCDLSIVEERMKNVNVETTASLEQGDKLNIDKTRSVSSSCMCIPYIPELQLERKCDCRPAFNYKYECVEECLKGNEIESRQKCDQEIIQDGCQRSRLYDVRNCWNSEVTTPSSCESNQYTSTNLRSSTSTESIICPRAITKITRLDRGRGISMFLDKSGKIGEGPWRGHKESVLKNSTSPLVRKMNTKPNYSNRNHGNQFTCRCGGTDQKVICDDRYEDTETSRSRTSFSSTSLSSYDRNRSPRASTRYNNCRYRNLASVASSTSTCTVSRAPEIEYRRVKEFSKTLNPLSLTSPVTDGNNNNGRFKITKLSYRRALSVTQRRRKENCEGTTNDLYY